MEMKSDTLASPREERVKYLESLLVKVENDSHNQRKQDYIGYINFCNKLEIATRFVGLRPNDNKILEEHFKEEFVEDIKTTIAICKSQDYNQPQKVEKTIMNITNSQSQNQKLDNSVIIMEAMRKSLTGEQYDEIKDLIDKKAKRETVLNKLASFGSSLLANILCNLLMATK